MCVCVCSALKGFDISRYVDGFDACTREVSDCLRSQNTAASRQLQSGLLSHLASCRSRLVLRGKHRDATALTPGEYVQENKTSCRSDDQLTRPTLQQRCEQKRIPLASIDNVAAAAAASTAANTDEAPLSCDHLPNSNHLCLSETSCADGSSRSTQSDRPINRNSDVSVSHDNVLSLVTEDSVSSTMWRPW